MDRPIHDHFCLETVGWISNGGLACENGGLDFLKGGLPFFETGRWPAKTAGWPDKTAGWIFRTPDNLIYYRTYSPRSDNIAICYRTFLADVR